jgi:dissimilatory sulfite reductase (desulfoviridin) alpha/beta subunit
MALYDNKHWEELIGVIIERIGVERFIEMTAYVLEQHGYLDIAEQIERLQHGAVEAQRNG